MRKNEQLFWDLIGKYLPGDVSRIENTVDAGTPDITCAAWGRDYWVELKSHPDADYISMTQVEKWIEPAQRVWHARRSKVGSLIFLIVRFRTEILAWYAEGITYVPAFHLVKLGNGYNWTHMKEAIRNHCDHTKLVF